MRRILTAVSVSLLVAWAGASAQAAGLDVQTRVADWSTAAATLGTAGSLWEPASTAGLRPRGGIAVLADGLTFANGAVTGGDTTAAAQYGSGSRVLRIEERWAGTGWAAEPVTSTTTAPVGTVRLRIGPPGTQATVVARVFADCFAQPQDANPRPLPRGYRCSRADVLRFGGTLRMTVRPPSTMTAPGTTAVVIRTRGLTYAQLIAIASGVQQVSGAPTVAGSAQMVGMCSQMVAGRMTLDEATAFAVSNGYTARAGSIDGQPQVGTADYRPDRFSLTIVANAVTGCTYG